MKSNILRNILLGWASLIVLLGIILIISIQKNYRVAFFIMLVSSNIILFVFAFLFRGKIEKMSNLLKLDFFRINNTFNSTSIVTRFNYEYQLTTFLISVIVIFSVYAISLTLTDAKSYFLFIQEDGLVEYASSICWFLAAIVLSASLIKQKKNTQSDGSKYVLYLYLALIILFILCGGEEISWGQRIFHEKTPEFLKSVNVQNELTLHNIGSISIFANFFFLFTVVFFLGVPYLMRRNVRLRNYLNYYYFPIPNQFVIYIFLITLVVWIFVGVRFGTLGFHPFTIYAHKYYTQMDDEIFECLTAYSFFAYSIMDLVRIRISNGKNI